MSNANDSSSIRVEPESKTVADQSLQLFRSLANLLEDVVFVWDPAGTMLWVNRAFEEQTGRSTADFVFPNPENPFIHPEDLPAVNARLDEFIRSTHDTSEPIYNRFFDAWGRSRPLRSIVHKVRWRDVSALLF